MLRTFSIQTPVFTLLYRGDDMQVSERRLAGGSVSIHELPTFLSCAAARLTPAIKMRQSLRQSAAWMVLFTSACSAPVRWWPRHSVARSG